MTPSSLHYHLVMWSRTRIDALDYPRVTMTLTLYTLSLDRTWLTI